MEQRMDMDVARGDSRVLPVAASTRKVVDKSRWVSLHLDLLDGAVAAWGHLLEDRGAWKHACHYFDGTEETVRWIFVLDVLNHCFWPDRHEPVWEVSYDGNVYSGYWGLAAALKRAVEEDFPVTNAAYLADLRYGDLLHMMRGEGQLPLIDQRLANLRETGRILQSRWGGDVVRLVDGSKGSAVRTVLDVVSSFPSFGDQASFGGETVVFWKRAQLFAADLHLAFGGTRWGCFEDLDRLTAFADYKLPQVLRELGVISYHPELASRIDGFVDLAAGGEEEIEIRSATIQAVEELRGAFLKAGRNVTSVAVDNWLWQLGQLEPFRRRPYHRCRTIYY